ncbi:MAG: hypothetical protein LN415_09055 [Candidatus Thermoplasmatota archaeon]|nr:hypothetical protein [Candidatus Thermoplasmatota archaeon]
MIYAEGHGSLEGQVGMKKDPYMMSIARYEARVKEMKKEEDIYYVAVPLGALIALLFIIILVLSGGIMHPGGWLMIVIGIALASGGAVGYRLLRKERKELEEWRSWESETQEALGETSKRDFE